jgi:hypothetical protein
MAKRKKKNSKTQRVYSIFKILIVFGFIGLLSVAFVLAEQYVESLHEVTSGKLVFDAPDWVNQTLLSKAYQAVGGEHFKLAEGVPEALAKELAKVPWLDQIKVSVATDTIHVKAHWRRPLALVKSGRVEFCVDRELVALDVVELGIPIVTISGVSFRRRPAIGTEVYKEDLAAAVDLIDVLNSHDQSEVPDKPLLAEIDRLDIENFRGRKSSRRPHIILYVKDGTPIYWGAELEESGQYLEESDRDKLAMLYGYYHDYDSSLLGSAKIIDLRGDPSRLHLPTD